MYEKGLNPLDPEAFELLANRTGALLLDTRDPEVFAHAFIPSAVNIGLNGQFAPWVGSLITDLEHPILLIVALGKEQEALTRLSRVGYDSTIGYLKGGMDAWIAAGKDVDSIASMSAAEFVTLSDAEDTINILDVRKAGEFEAGHLDNAALMPLDYINDWTSEIKPTEKYYIHCAGGYRSMIAASILKARGIDQVVNVAGGYAAIKAEKV